MAQLNNLSVLGNASIDGTLSLNNGAASSILKGDGSTLAIGTADQTLIVNKSGNAPIWKTLGGTVYYEAGNIPAYGDSAHTWIYVYGAFTSQDSAKTGDLLIITSTYSSSAGSLYKNDVFKFTTYNDVATSWCAEKLGNICDLPIPTSSDSGKVLSVNSSGKYTLTAAYDGSYTY